MSMYGWKLVDNSWEPVWFEGKALPDPDDLSDDEVEGDDEMRNEDVEADKDGDDSLDSSTYVTSEYDGNEDSDYDPCDM